MGELVVVVGSITSATRLQKRLSRHGDRRARVIQTPVELGGGGCSYSVIAERTSEGFVKNNHQGITIKGVYAVEQLGGERVYYDISR